MAKFYLRWGRIKCYSWYVHTSLLAIDAELRPMAFSSRRLPAKAVSLMALARTGTRCLVQQYPLVHHYEGLEVEIDVVLDEDFKEHGTSPACGSSVRLPTKSRSYCRFHDSAGFGSSIRDGWAYKVIQRTYCSSLSLSAVEAEQGTGRPHPLMTVSITGYCCMYCLLLLK